MISVTQWVQLVLVFIEGLSYIDVLHREDVFSEEKCQNLNHSVESSPDTCLNTPRQSGIYSIDCAWNWLSCDIVVDTFGPLGYLSPGVD